jgi:hypothetical protein
MAALRLHHSAVWDCCKDSAKCLKILISLALLRSLIYSRATEFSHAPTARHPPTGMASLWELVIKKALGRA